jgi:hypothetical protein
MQRKRERVEKAKDSIEKAKPPQITLIWKKVAQVHDMHFFLKFLFFYLFIYLFIYYFFFGLSKNVIFKFQQVFYGNPSLVLASMHFRSSCNEIQVSCMQMQTKQLRGQF